MIPFVRLPRKHRYMVKGSVTMSFQARAVSRRQVATEPVELDIRPGDKAIYLGTLRLHRDEFHEVTKALLKPVRAK